MTKTWLQNRLIKVKFLIFGQTKRQKKSVKLKKIVVWTPNKVYWTYYKGHCIELKDWIRIALTTTPTLKTENETRRTSWILK